MKLDEKTTVPFFIAVLSIGTAAMWLSSVYSNVSANSRKIEQLETKQDEYNGTIQKIQTDIAVIKIELQRMNKE